MSNQPEHQNIHGQKITVKHYLNTALKPHKEVWTDGKVYEAYPLYVQVNVKKQTAQFRSVLNVYAAPEYLTEYLESYRIKQLVEDEIAQVVRRILRAKPFDSQNFKLSDVMNGFIRRDFDLRNIIGQYLLKDYREARHADLQQQFERLYKEYPIQYQFGIERSDDAVRSFLESESVGTMQLYQAVTPYQVFRLIRAEATDANWHIKGLVNRYGMGLMLLDQYMNNIERFARRLPTLGLYTSDEFEAVFKSACGTDNSNNNNHLFEELINGVNLLADRHLELKVLLAE